MDPVRDAVAVVTAALGDRYAIDRELGRGGMATVYVAQDRRHAREVAIKVLRPDVAAVIADFGIARAICQSCDGQNVTEVGLTIGTPEYMSPEQAAGDRDLDGRSDLYSLACVIYETLAGEPPFAGASARAVMAQHLSEAPPPLRARRPDAPAAVEQALARALAKDPADRFATVAQFVTALEATHAPGAVPALA